MDCHVYHAPRWASEADTHDRLVETFARIIHSNAFDDLTSGASTCGPHRGCQTLIY
jgi:hypothetical protein